MYNCCNNSTRAYNCCPRCNCSCGWYQNRCPAINCYSIPPTTVTNSNTPNYATGYFTNATATVASGATIPLTLNKISGNTTNISQGTNGILLQPGTYIVDYSLTGSSTSGTSVGVALNGTTQPLLTQTTASSSTTASDINVSNSGVITVTSPNTLLTLQNLGADSATITNANVVVQQIA